MERKPYSNSTRPRSGGTAARRSGFVRPSGADPRAAAPRGGYVGGASRRDPQPGSHRGTDHRRAYAGPTDPRAPQSRRMPERGRPDRRAPRPKKRRRISLPLLLICAFVLVVLIYLGSAWIVVSRNADTFCSNIIINGIDLGGYTRAGGIQAVQDQIAARLNTPYTLTYGADSWSFTARDFDARISADDIVERAWNFGHYGSLFSRKNDIQQLEKTPIEWNAEMTYDSAKIDAFVQQIGDAVNVEPINAEVTVTAERPYLTTESKLGMRLDTEKTREMIIALVETGAGETALPVEIAEPAISSSQASGALQVIVEVKTDVTFRGWSSRSNVRLALSKFDGMCIWPGETISFNEVVGPRTGERGFQLATEFAGNRTQKGYGGGVCQASTTLYNALLKAGMTIIERSPHTMTVTYVDPSMDAAVTDTGKDLVFKNDTDSAIYIYTSVGKEFATVTIWGNRPQYRNELMSVVTRKDETTRYTDYVDDTDGRYVYYVTDTPVLYSEGQPSLASEGWLISYDWDTGEEVRRYQLSFDSYRSGTTLYWRGIHDPVTGEAVNPDEYKKQHS